MIRIWKNLEFSKKLLIFTEFIVAFVAILSAVAVIMGNVEPLTALITASFGLASMSFGFYFWKAKCENMKKWSKGLSYNEIKKIIDIYKGLGGNDNDESVSGN